MHLAQRLTAFLAGILLRPQYIPAAYNYTAFLLTLLVVADAMSARLRLDYKPLMALAVVLVPQYDNVVFLTITNIQWILALLLVTTLLKEPPREQYGNVRLQKLWDVAIVAICGLTGPFVIFLWPFFLLKWKSGKTGFSAVLFSVASLAAAVQISFILCSVLSAPHEAGFRRAFLYLSVVASRICAGIFLGTSACTRLGEFAESRLFVYACCAALASMAVMILHVAGEKARFRHASVMLVLMAGVTGGVLLKFRTSPESLLPVDNGPWYFYIPAVMIAWSLIICVDNRMTLRNVVIWLLLCAMLSASVTSAFVSKPLPDLDWQTHSRLIGTISPLVIPINPQGWYVELDSSAPKLEAIHRTF